MSIKPIASLELYWKGPYTYQSTGNIKALDFQIKGGSHSVEANLDTNKSCEMQQNLQFITQKKTESSPTSKKVSATLFAPPSLFKTMEVSARIFQNEERRDVPVFIGSIPEFQSGKTYQLRIENNNDSLHGVIREKIQPKKEDKENKTKPSSSTSAGAKNDVELLIKYIADLRRKGTNSTPSTPYKEEILEGFQEALHTGFVSENPELSTASTLDLENRLKELKLKRRSAHSDFNDACVTGIGSRISETFQAKYKISSEIAAIGRELDKRGIILG